MMKKRYKAPATEATAVRTEGSMLIGSWEVKNPDGSNETDPTHIVDENPNDPIGDKDFAKRGFWDE